MTVAAPSIEFKEIALRTGVSLRFATMGPRSGQPALLLHGYSDSWFSFSRVIADLSPELRLIIPDQRGHGDSDRPLGGYTQEHFSADAVALLEALGISKAVIIGHSMGSFTARRIAAAAPERVSRMVLVGSAASLDNEAVRSFAEVVAQLTDPIDPVFVREFQLSTVYRPLPPDFLERVVTESLKLPARVWKAVLAGLLDMPVPAMSPNIRCPAAILWGDRDTMFDREDQEELLRQIPGATLQVIKDAGHSPHWDAPEEFMRHLAVALQS